MKADISSMRESNTVGKYRKDNGFYKQLTVVDRFCAPVITARFYTTSNRVYACIWFNTKKTKNKSAVFAAGGGFAGGYGYCKESAALENAIESAGVTLDKALGGTGENEKALTAIARALGYRKFTILRANA